MLKPLTNDATNHSSNPLSTKINKPSVSTVIGSVSTNRMGRMMVLITLSISATISAVVKVSMRIESNR